MLFFAYAFYLPGGAFVTGILMLQPEFQLFDAVVQQWMGTSQISICIVFLVIYFSVLSLQQLMEIRQNAKGDQIVRCLGKSTRQIERLVHRQITIRLTAPMIMALLIISCCAPLLNARMNCILPDSLHNILLKLTGAFGACIGVFYICYFEIVRAMGKRYIFPSD